MKYRDKTTGVVYTKIKCQNCGKKSLLSHELKEKCPNCGSEVDYHVKRSEMISGKFGLFIIFSSICSFIGGLVGTAIPLINNSYLDLIWTIPLSIFIGAIIPFIIYIGLWIIFAYITTP